LRLRLGPKERLASEYAMLGFYVSGIRWQIRFPLDGSENRFLSIRSRTAKRKSITLQR